MSTKLSYVEDSESGGLLMRELPQSSLQKAEEESLLHIPNEFRDNDELLDLVLKGDIYNFTICIQDNNCLSAPLTSFPDAKKLSNWLILLLKKLDQKHNQESNRPAIKVFLVAVDEFIDKMFVPNHKPEEHKEHQKILPVWWPWPTNTSRVSSEEARYSDKINDPKFRLAYSEWQSSLQALLEGEGKRIDVDFAEMPLACKCEGIWQKVYDKVKEIPDGGYVKYGGHEIAFDFSYRLQ